MSDTPTPDEVKSILTNPATYLGGVDKVLMELRKENAELKEQLTAALARAEKAEADAADMREAIDAKVGGISSYAYMQKEFPATVGHIPLRRYFEGLGSALCCATGHRDSELSALRARVSELEKDKARLDWLEARSTQLDSDYETGEREVYEITGGINDRQWDEIGKGETIRSAIDAAIAATEPQ